MSLVQRPQAGASVLSLLDRESCATEQLRHETPDISVVVDHEHPGGIHTFLILNPTRVPYHPGRE